MRYIESPLSFKSRLHCLTCPTAKTLACTTVYMYILCVYAQELGGGGGVRPLPYVIHAAKFGVIVEL